MSDDASLDDAVGAFPQPDDPPCHRPDCDSDLHCDRCGGVHHAVARMHEPRQGATEEA